MSVIDMYISEVCKGCKLEFLVNKKVKCKLIELI